MKLSADDRESIIALEVENLDRMYSEEIHKGVRRMTPSRMSF